MENEKALNIVEKWVNRVYNKAQKEIDKLKTQIPETDNITRVEVIDQKGRSYVNWKPNNKVKISIQDEGRTMKIFINDK